MTKSVVIRHSGDKKTKYKTGQVIHVGKDQSEEVVISNISVDIVGSLVEVVLWTTKGAEISGTPYKSIYSNDVELTH